MVSFNFCPFQSDPVFQQRKEKKAEGTGCYQQGNLHRFWNIYTLGCDHHRVDGPPNPDGKKSNRYVGKTDDPEDCRQVRALILSHNPPEHQVGKINKPENQCCRQSGIPGPPDIPDRFCPYGAGDQNDGTKQNTDFSRTLCDYIPFSIFCIEVKNTAQKGDKKTEKRQKSGRNMNIEDLLDNAHGFFDGRIDEDGV